MGLSGGKDAGAGRARAPAADASGDDDGIPPHFAGGYAANLDKCIRGALASPDLRGIPGVVVYARRGRDEYHRCLGKADAQRAIPMGPDTIFRMYSMTKVMASTVALMLQEQAGGGVFNIDDPVSKFIPSFDREQKGGWDVVEEAEEGEGDALSVAYYDMVEGRSKTLWYRRRKSFAEMLVKHLMCEASGIGYDLFSEGRCIAGTNAYAVASALRRQVGKEPTVYRSSSIVGQPCTIDRMCNIIAEAGVLVCDPGEFSYGLGAAVLGRVIEVVDARVRGEQVERSFDEVCRARLFRPLQMSSAMFFAGDGDPAAQRFAALYGITKDAEGNTVVVPAERSVPQAPASEPGYSNHTDHIAGPRRQLSGDTGACMTVRDYARFCNFLLSGGVVDGVRLLSKESVEAVCTGKVEGITFSETLSRNMALGEQVSFPQVFTYGCCKPLQGARMREGGRQPHDHPAQAFWSGYAGNHFRVYRGEDSLIVIGVQVMDHHGTGALDAVLRRPLLQEFLELWRGGNVA